MTNANTVRRVPHKKPVLIMTTPPLHVLSAKKRMTRTAGKQGDFPETSGLDWAASLHLCAKHNGPSGTELPEGPFSAVLIFEDLFSRRSPHDQLLSQQAYVLCAGIRNSSCRELNCTSNLGHVGAAIS